METGPLEVHATDCSPASANFSASRFNPKARQMNRQGRVPSNREGPRTRTATSLLFELSDIANGAASRIGRQRSISAQGRRDMALAAKRFPGRVAHCLHRRATVSEHG